MGTGLFSSGTYQGYSLQGWTVDRKPGLAGDLCYVDLDVAELKAILLNQKGRLWDRPGIKEPPGPFLLQITDKVRAGLPHQTVTDEKPASGLDRGGPLIFSSTVNAKTISPPIRLDPMYLVPSAIDELIDEINSQKHDEGLVRVTISDIRYFWKDRGTPVYGDYNIELPNGELDRLTLAEDGNPHTLRAALDYICLCLPGSPKVDGTILGQLPPPKNLKMRHDLPIVWLSQLMEAYDIEPHLSHDSTTVWFDRRSRDHVKNEFPAMSGGKAAALGEQPSVEKKTVFTFDRPEAVAVVGGMREQRNTVSYEPAFIDVDGKIKRLFEIESIWGMSWGQVLACIANYEHVDTWQDFVPGADLRQKVHREKIAQRYFFKLFAPSSLFVDTDADGNVSTGTSIYWDFEKRHHPLFPAIDPWFLPGEVPAYNQEVANPFKSKPKANPSGAALIQMPVLVKAQQIRQVASNDVSAVTDRIVSQIKTDQDLIKYHTNKINVLKAKIKRLDEPEDDFKQAGVGPFAPPGAILTIKLAKGLEHTADFLKGLGISLLDLQYEKKIAEYKDLQAKLKETDRDIMRKVWTDEVEFESKRIVEIAQEIAKQQAFVDSIKKAVTEVGYFRGWANIPFGPVEPGEYTFDRENGLLLFHEKVGVMESPVVFDQHSISYVSPGSVEVTFGSEKRTGSPSDQTSFVVVLNSSGTPSLAICESSQPSGVKPLVVDDRRIVIYENEQGQAMNFDVSVKKAGALALPILSQPDKVDGYYYEYEGIWKVATDGRINQVTWQCSGDYAITQITANFPDKLNVSGSDSVARKRLREEIVYDPERIA